MAAHRSHRAPGDQGLGIEMSKATEIMWSAPNANDAMNAAEALTDNVEQFWWGDGATFYTFDDESVLLVSGAQVNAFADIDAAKDAVSAEM
jgi:hypothetical protein